MASASCITNCFKVFLLVLSSSLLLYADEDQLKVKLGENVTLQCQIPKNAVIRLLEWIRPDLRSDGYVFFYREGRPYENYQHESYRGRVELKDPEMKDGDVSVILKNVTINDAGTYECYVKINSTGRDTELINNITLNVLEPGHREERGEKCGRVVLVAGLSALVLCLCGIGLFIYKKHQQLPCYQPPEKAAEQQRV